MAEEAKYYIRSFAFKEISEDLEEIEPEYLRETLKEEYHCRFDDYSYNTKKHTYIDDEGREIRYQLIKEYWFSSATARNICPILNPLYLVYILGIPKNPKLSASCDSIPNKYAPGRDPFLLNLVHFSFFQHVASISRETYDKIDLAQLGETKDYVAAMQNCGESEEQIENFKSTYEKANRGLAPLLQPCSVDHYPTIEGRVLNTTEHQIAKRILFFSTPTRILPGDDFWDLPLVKFFYDQKTKVWYRVKENGSVEEYEFFDIGDQEAFEIKY